MPGERNYPLMVVGLAILLAVVMHWPALTNLGTHIPGEPASDVLRAWWSAWLVAAELPGWPFSTDRVNFPVGAQLLPFPAASLVAVAPTTRLFGAAVAITMLVVGHGVMAFVASAALVRTLGGGWGGALLAGSLVAAQPILGGALRDGTIEVLAVGWMPLTMLAMVKACRGSRRWGVAAGLFFLITCLESVYYGSFTAVAVLACLATLRGRDGVFGALIAGVTVFAGVTALALVFSPVLEGITSALGTAQQDPGALRSSNAAQLDLMKPLALSPGSRGWRVSDLYVPPLAHWIVFGLGGLLALRRVPWMPALGGVFFLLAIDHASVALWADGPIGQVVRFPPRYMAAFAVAMACGAGVGARELLRWPKVEAGVGLLGAAFLGWVGAFSSGHLLAYPLLDLPQPDFVTQLAEDPEDSAVMLLPLSIPGARFEMRSEAPVFAGLSSNIASADHLAMQVLANKASWYTPTLVTLALKPGTEEVLARDLSDLARPRYGLGLPDSANVDIEEFEISLRWLKGSGLKYVAVATDSYQAAELQRIEAILGDTVSVQDYDDGTGVRLYQLYETRPEVADAPVKGQSAVQQPSFTGAVTLPEGRAGELIVRVKTGGFDRDCPLDEQLRFDCGEMASVDEVHVVIDGEPALTHWNGSMSDAILSVDGEAAPGDAIAGGAGMVFQGVLKNRKGLTGLVEIVASGGGKSARCPVTPETGAYQCGGVETVDTVVVLAEKKPLEASWDGVFTGGVITILTDDAP